LTKEQKKLLFSIDLLNFLPFQGGEIMSSYDRDLAHLLRTGKIEAFNASRPQEKESGAEVNLSRIDLSGKSIAKANLSKVVLRNANLSGAILIDTVLKGADITNAVLDGAVMIDTNLSYAHVSGVDFTKVAFITGINVWGTYNLSQEQQGYLLKKIKKSWNCCCDDEGPTHISIPLAKIIRQRLGNHTQN